MRKAAILTMKAPNYGGILQAYALQKAVRMLGYTCDTIDYINPYFRQRLSFFGKPKNMKLIYWIYKKVQYPLTVIKTRRLMPFFNRINQTEKIKKREELSNLNKDYDVFITGSDQVWACDLIHYDESFFLDFALPEKTKISYAASFGRTIDMMPENEKEFIAKNLDNIDYIGLREKSGIDIVNALSKKKSVAVLDPTLLLSKPDYEKAAVSPKRKEPFVLCYLMQSRTNDRAGLRIAKAISKATGWKIVKVFHGLTSVIWGETIHIPTVEEWLGLYSEASFIITNSFHGTAFAINFNKQFLSIVEGEPSSGRNDRIYNICKLFELEDRIVSPESEVEYNSMNLIDYNNVNEELGKLRDTSLAFLKNSIEGCS